MHHYVERLQFADHQPSRRAKELSQVSDMLPQVSAATVLDHIPIDRVLENLVTRHIKKP